MDARVRPYVTHTVDTYDMYMLTDMEPVTREVSTNSDGAITVTSSNEKKGWIWRGSLFILRQHPDSEIRRYHSPG